MAALTRGEANPVGSGAASGDPGGGGKYPYRPHSGGPAPAQSSRISPRPRCTNGNWNGSSIDDVLRLESGALDLGYGRRVTVSRGLVRVGSTPS